MTLTGMQGALIGGGSALGAFGLLVAADAVAPPTPASQSDPRAWAAMGLTLGAVASGVTAVAGAAFVNSAARGPYVVGALAGAALGTGILAVATGNDTGALLR